MKISVPSKIQEKKSDVATSSLFDQAQPKRQIASTGKTERDLMNEGELVEAERREGESAVAREKYIDSLWNNRINKFVGEIIVKRPTLTHQDLINEISTKYSLSVAETKTMLEEHGGFKF